MPYILSIHVPNLLFLFKYSPHICVLHIRDILPECVPRCIHLCKMKGSKNFSYENFEFCTKFCLAYYYYYYYYYHHHHHHHHHHIIIIIRTTNSVILIECTLISSQYKH